MSKYILSANIKIILIICILTLIILILLAKYNYNIDNHEYFTNTDLDIPKTIYLSYKTKKIPDYVIPKWKALNPDYDVQLFDNNDCINFLKSNYSDPTYVDIFNYIKDGPIKADFWRVCILYKLGGVYSDIDVNPIVGINEFIEPGTYFLTCLSANDKIGNSMNPHFIISKPDNPIFKRCIELYFDKYKLKKYDYWGWSIVHIMRKAIDEHFGYKIVDEGVYTDKNNNNFQFLQEVMPANKDDYAHYCKYNDTIILYNRYEKYKNHGF